MVTLIIQDQWIQQGSNQMISQKGICLNPKCPKSHQRILTEEQYKNHKKCAPWIITPSSINIPFSQQGNPLEKQINIDFEHDGINFIKRIANLQGWPIHINTIFQNLKLFISNQIDLIKNKKIQQFKQIYDEAKQAFMQLNKTIQSIDNQSLVIESKKFYQLQKYVSINLNQFERAEHYFQKSLKQSLNTLGDLIQSTGYTYDQILRKSQNIGVQKTNSFFEDNSILVNQKIIRLTNAFQISMVKTSFDNQISLFKTNCWICEKAVFSLKQDSSRNGCLQQLLNHLISQHPKEVYLNYMIKILRYDVQEIRFEKFIQKIKTQQFKQVYVIDRQNAGLIQKPLQIKQGQLFIQVMNKQNKNLAKGIYILADSKRKDAADILITILIYQLLNNDAQKIILVTKDHFGITFLEVMQNMFPKRLQCIEPKQFCQRLYGTVISDSEMK